MVNVCVERERSVAGREIWVGARGRQGERRASGVPCGARVKNSTPGPPSFQVRAKRPATRHHWPAHPQVIYAIRSPAACSTGLPRPFYSPTVCHLRIHESSSLFPPLNFSMFSCFSPNSTIVEKQRHATQDPKVAEPLLSRLPLSTIPHRQSFTIT